MRWEPVPTTYGLANKMISLFSIRTQRRQKKTREPLGGNDSRAGFLLIECDYVVLLSVIFTVVLNAN